MNVGIIGTGGIAEQLAIAINNVEGANLFAVSSRSLEKAKAFAEKFNASKWYEGTDEFLKCDSIDLVYIATPNSSHCALTSESIKSGKAVLCEKPFAMNSREALEMVELSQDRGVYLVEAMWTKYFPAVEKVKELLNSKQFGEIISLYGDLSYPLNKEAARLYKKEMGGGALLDLGVYPITMSHILLGSPENIEANSNFSESGVDTTTSMSFKYKSGATAILNCSMVAHSTNEFLISCTNGWIRINGDFHNPQSISYKLANKEDVHLNFPRTGNGYEYQVESVMKDLEDNKTQGSVVKLSDTLEIMNILDSVREKIGYNF